ncbi:MAG: hypothetical protein ACEQSA_04285 [Weeksellaceae bacterium]
MDPTKDNTLPQPADAPNTEVKPVTPVVIPPQEPIMPPAAPVAEPVAPVNPPIESPKPAFNPEPMAKPVTESARTEYTTSPTPVITPMPVSPMRETLDVSSPGPAPMNPAVEAVPTTGYQESKSPIVKILVGFVVLLALGLGGYYAYSLSQYGSTQEVVNPVPTIDTAPSPVPPTPTVTPSSEEEGELQQLTPELDETTDFEELDQEIEQL